MLEVKAMNTYPTEIAAAASKHGVPLPLLTAQVAHESNFDPFAIGDGGEALGLLQVHPGAASDVGGNWAILKAAISNKDEALAVQLSLDIGAAYLAQMLTLFEDDPKLALMAYNQGPTVISRALRYAKAIINSEGVS
jgi:soluble lytic murein transglycosylase-like protein